MHRFESARPWTALMLTLLALPGCSARPRARTALPVSAASRGAPSSKAPREAPPPPAEAAAVAAVAPIVGAFHAHVHAPGVEPKVHVNVSLTGWTLTGCISEVEGACDKTGSFDVGPAARAELVGIWNDVRATPRCEPEGRWKGDRFFEITHGDDTFAGRLPASDADLPARNAGPCRAGARLAMWFVHQFRDRPQ